MNKLTYMLKFKPRELLVPTTLALMLTLGGCVSLEPTLPVAITGVASNWPLPATSAKLASATVPAEIGDSDTGVVADIGGRDFFTDPKLVEIIAHALDNNRDLRVAVLNVERARAQYDIQRAGQVPSIGVNGTVSRGGGLVATPGTVYSASVGLSSFELDLFGRVHNLSQAALQQYFAQEQARRAAQLSLIAEVARAYLTLASDLEAQRVAQATLDNQQAAFDLIVKRHRAGAVSGLDVSQAETTVESARVDRARYVGQVATDRNALVLLVGAPIEATLLPNGLLPAESGLLPLPPGLPSQVLLRRPDVLQAEYQLRSANASIGAARAAFFPSISLTGSVGTASTELSGLFGAGSRTWSFVPQINLPIFQGGRLRASLGMAKAERDIALAQYEKSIQNSFREVADALAQTSALAERRQAQERLVKAAKSAQQLSRQRYDRGRDSFLVLLDAERTLYAAQQGLVTAQLAEQSNRVMLYKVLGGGWEEHSR